MAVLLLLVSATAAGSSVDERFFSFLSLSRYSPNTRQRHKGDRQMVPRCYYLSGSIAPFFRTPMQRRDVAACTRTRPATSAPSPSPLLEHGARQHQTTLQ
ncbi:hypothetical protein HDK77DRAFT_457212 [Phyllosticta capitalensis]